MEESDIKKQHISDHLANERTLLAWIRTAIGIMAFGFVVVKFSLFVKQISLLLGHVPMPQARGYSAILGIMLVAIGAITSVLAYLRYRKTKSQISEQVFQSSSLLISLLTGSIFLISIFLIWYLVIST